MANAKDKDVPVTEADGGTPADQTNADGTQIGTYKDNPDKPAPQSVAQVQEVPERADA